MPGSHQIKYLLKVCFPGYFTLSQGNQKLVKLSSNPKIYYNLIEKTHSKELNICQNISQF